MSRQKGTPNKSKDVRVTQVDQSKSITHERPEPDTERPTERAPMSKEENYTRLKNDINNWPKSMMPRYVICQYSDVDELALQVSVMTQEYKCVGGIAVHDIRNPLTNEYEPHYYQAMEKE